MVLCINPIHSVIFFIMIFFCASVIFTLLHVDFIGIIFLMVYVGAIAVLFLFVVMMLNIRRMERDNTTYLLIGGFISFLFFFQLTYTLILSNTTDLSNNIFSTMDYGFDSFQNKDELSTKYAIQLLGIQLFSKYYILVILSGLILLIALIGSVYLTNMKTGYSVRRQDNQLNRNAFLLNVHSY
jgi:NADH-quinone oxidoreductase subunit J